MPTLSYLDAGRRALADEMRRDPRVFALGEDLGRGGVFGQYHGLQDAFGPRRVVDAPISEAGIMAAAVGAAMVGARPVVEMRFSDFALCAVDELVNQAAKARYMFGGQMRVPLVVRQPTGSWRSSAAQHSQSLEAWWTHIPGLVVTAPATPADNLGLLTSAIRCDDPVVHLEHKTLWGLEGEVADGEHIVPFGRARIARAGRDLTLVTWSATVHRAIEAAEMLATEGIETEILDLRTLWPWDRDAVLASAARTGRLLVTHEAVEVAGFGAEIAAAMADALFGRLKAPVRRLGAPRVPIPYAPNLEARLCIDAARIAAAARALASYPASRPPTMPPSDAHNTTSGGSSSCVS